HAADGEKLKLQIQAETEQALARIPADSKHAKPNTLFLLGAGDRGLMAAGHNTQAAAMLNLVQARNAVSYEGYKPMSAEGALQAAPDTVIVGHTRPGSHEAIIDTLAMTPASQNNRIHTVDVGMVLGFGPRLPEAVDQLIELIWQPDTQNKTAQVD
ncbi:MAG: ABC transporter substrate-binding protein, partial [Oceanobacter sp.]